MKSVFNYSILATVILLISTWSVRANDFYLSVEKNIKMTKGLYNGINHDFSKNSEKEEKSKSTRKFEPHFRIDNSIVSFNLLSLNEESARVMVYNNNYELLYSDTVKGGKNLGKMFDFSKAEKGNYFIVIKYNNNLYTKTIVR